MTGAGRLGQGVRRGVPLTLDVDGQRVEAYHGETIAAAMLASGRRTCRLTPRGGVARGLFCGMGVCFDCVVMVEGKGRVRGCTTLVEEGMAVRTGIR